MQAFEFFASNFTLINEINDTAGRYLNEVEALADQSEKRPRRP
jgi:hypothetical protein